MKRVPWMALAFLAVLSPASGQVPGRGGWRIPERRTLEYVVPLQWGTRAAAHLMRRAGFGASPAELKRIVDQGFDRTLDELLHPEQVDDSQAEADLLQRHYPLVNPVKEMNFHYGDLLNMQRVWLHRMIHSRCQLLEKMTFFWHDHFATSFEGVPFATLERGPLMQIQNETLRAHALGSFREILHAVARDPAMVLWLNNFENKSPVEFAVEACRELEIGDPVNLPALLFFFPLGQQLFLPPDVGGWPSDSGWINTGSLLARNNLLTIITSKRPDLDFGLPGEDVVPVEGIAQQNGLFLGADFVGYFLDAMLQGDVSVDTRHTLEDYLNTGDFGVDLPFDATDPGVIDKKVRGLIQLISFLPVCQLN